jgi:O-antigen/teichoic acid export membrane protein
VSPSPAPSAATRPGRPIEDQTLLIARNLSTRYLAIGTEMALGLIVLPMNVSYLGPAAYGLWMLAWSVTSYFTMLDLGYQNGLIKYVAQYRAKGDTRALNEMLSTMFVVLTGLAAVVYLAAIAAAVHLDVLFQLSPEQVHLGRMVLLIVTLHVAASLAFGVFGALINGFQRYDLNNVVGAVTGIVTALVNIAVLLAGYGLIELVAATTVVRLLSYLVYRANAYRVFPSLSVRPSLFRVARLREITPFSMHMAVIDWAHKLNHSFDVIVIGAFLNTTLVAVWAVAQRLADATQRLSNQLNEVLFPTVVDNDAASRLDRLQNILLIGTRLSLATVVPIAGALLLNASPLILAWVGPGFAESALVLQILALTVVARVGTSTANTILKGAGKHRLVAATGVVTALVNLSLSLLLIRRFGLPGVAVGTLIPVLISSALVVFPAGCRRLDVPLARAWREAVWPALWPASVMTGFMLLTRDAIPSSLVLVVAHTVSGMLVYVLTFAFLAVWPEERRFFIARLRQLIGSRRTVPVPMASEGA